MPKAINPEFLCKIQVMKGVGMRNKKCILVMVCIAFLGLSDFSLAADVAKIGVVDLQRVMETSDPGKSNNRKTKWKPI